MLTDPLPPTVLKQLTNPPHWHIGPAPNLTAAPGVEATTTTTAAPDDAWYVTTICPRCGSGHTLPQCPQVKAIEYDGDGRVRRVEFHEVTGPAAPPEVTVSWGVPLDVVRGDWGSGKPISEILKEVNDRWRMAERTKDEEE